MDKEKGHAWQSWAGLALGVIVMGLAYPLFFIEHQIAPGGLTGVATVIHHMVPIPVGLLTFLLNLPLFFISFLRKGRGFVLRSFIAMMGVSAVIDLAPVAAVTTDPMLAAVAGGVMLGVGLGFVLRSGTTTGGTDMAAALIHEKFPVISVGGVLWGIDCVVILAAGLVFDFQVALYSMVALYLSTKLMDQVIEGLNTAKAFFIITDEHEQLTKEIMTQMDRGVTLLHGKGGYSGVEREVLLCVVTRLQTMQLKRIVSQVDAKAFVIVTDVHEAMGEGFKEVKGQ